MSESRNGTITYIVVSILFVLFLTGFGLCLAQNNRTDDKVSDLNAKVDSCILRIYGDISGTNGIKEKMAEIDKRLTRMEARECRGVCENISDSEIKNDGRKSGT